MSYIIYASSGTVLTTIPTGKTNTATTSLTLIGRDVANYGRYINQNLVYMLSNSANTTNKSPNNPLTGQLWFDTTYNKLKVNGNTGFQVVGAAVINDLQPVGQEPGEFWYDSTQGVLNFLDNDGQYTDLITSHILETSNVIIKKLTVLEDISLDDGFTIDPAIYNNTTALYNFDNGKNIWIGTQELGNSLSIPETNNTTSAVTLTGSNGVTIVADSSQWTFDTDGTLTAPGDISTTGMIFANGLEVTGGVTIVADSNQWTFDTDGTLTLPNGAVINSTAVSTSTVNYYNYDASNLTVSVTTGTTVDFPNFSGQILLNDYIDGQVELWLAGGGVAYRLGSSKIGNGDQTLGNVTASPGISGYTWTSSKNSTMVFVATRTRPEA